MTIIHMAKVTKWKALGGSLYSQAANRACDIIHCIFTAFKLVYTTHKNATLSWI